EEAAGDVVGYVAAADVAEVADDGGYGTGDVARDDEAGGQGDDGDDEADGQQNPARGRQRVGHAFGDGGGVIAAKAEQAVDRLVHFGDGGTAVGAVVGPGLGVLALVPKADQAGVDRADGGGSVDDGGQQALFRLGAAGGQEVAELAIALLGLLEDRRRELRLLTGLVAVPAAARFAPVFEGNVLFVDEEVPDAHDRANHVGLGLLRARGERRLLAGGIGGRVDHRHHEERQAQGAE